MTKFLPKQISQILGYNARALRYTNRPTNSSATRLARSKLATKKTLQKAGLPTPRLYTKISTRQELKHFRWTKLPSSFVLKPNNSYGGSGIRVVFGRNKKGNWVLANKAEIFIPELKSHVLNILDGNFSPANVPDIALFEQRIKNHPDLKHYCVQGIPDIRVIVYNLVPIMAMLRLPTHESHGKANLHAGGIGVGIDLSRGLTTTAIYRGRTIETLPHKQLRVAGLRLPYWSDVLHTAVKATSVTGLPYAGVDIAIDRDDGPLILEINAHPGLDIQLANMAPLRSRLKRVEDLQVTSPQRGVQIGKNLFGGSLEQEVAEITGQTVLGVIEPVQIIDSGSTSHTHPAKIDTGAWRTTIDKKLAKEYGLHSRIVHHKKVRGALGAQERPVVDLPIILHDTKIKTHAFVADRSHMKFDIIIGRRDLRGFLVDPSKNTRGRITSKK